MTLTKGKKEREDTMEFKPAEKYTGHPIKLSRRPERDKVINSEDILNLRIALETSRTWEEFLSRV